MHLNHCVAVPLYRKGSEAYDLYLLLLSINSTSIATYNTWYEIETRTEYEAWSKVYLYITLCCTVYNNFMLYYRIILYYYHWYCTVLSLYCTCGSPNRKESSPNSSSTICCKLEPPPPSSPRPPRSCGLVPSSVQVQLPVSVHRLTCATLCSFSSLLRAPKLTSPG